MTNQERKAEAATRIRRGLMSRKAAGVKVREGERQSRRRAKGRNRRRLLNQRVKAQERRGQRSRRKRVSTGQQHGVRLGSLVNQVAKGPGSQRRGKKASIIFKGGSFFHDYGGSIGKIRLRKSNPLVGNYRKLLAAHRANTNRDRSGMERGMLGGERGRRRRRRRRSLSQQGGIRY